MYVVPQLQTISSGGKRDTRWAKLLAIILIVHYIDTRRVMFMFVRKL